MEARVARGKRTPAFDSRPGLYVDLQPIWQAFWDLHSSRAAGFGPCPISTEAIVAWLDLHAYTDVQRRVEVYGLLLMMDQVWLTWAAEQRENGRKDK